MKLFTQGVLPVILLGMLSINESLAHPPDIFLQPASCLVAFVLAQNHPSGVIPHSVLCRMLRHFVRFFDKSDNIPDAA